MTDLELAIVLGAQALIRARLELAALILRNCPGPHHFVQRRDHNEPWCETCRYTTTGFQV